MGKGLEGPEFKECLSLGKIKKFPSAVKLVSKELKSAKEDLETAQVSFRAQNFKWATIQTYYSMFHAARALIFSKGYRERSHYCLIVALRTFFVEAKLLDFNLVEAIEMGKLLRENADYEDEFSNGSAQSLLDKAKKLLCRCEEILKNKKSTG